MGLIDRIESLEERMEELRLDAEWKEEVPRYAESWGISEEEMREIWLRAIGPRPCSSPERMCALLEHCPRADDVESSD